MHVHARVCTHVYVGERNGEKYIYFKELAEEIVGADKQAGDSGKSWRSNLNL